MANTDTVMLLRECDAGTKMAVSSIDEVLDNVSSSKISELLIESKKHHGILGNKIHELLLEHHSDDKDPAPMAKGMSWLKTNIKMGLDGSDSAIADLITDGCNMGVKSLYKYLNQYKAADDVSKGICRELIKIEEQLVSSLKDHL